MRTDNRGISHPTGEDAPTPWGMAHIACCAECAHRWSSVSYGRTIGPLPLEAIAIPPAPTGRARHRKEPCEEADSGCTNAAAWRGVHIACGWGPLWCTPCIAIWKQQVDALDYTAGKGFQCKACKEQINGPDEMEARPLT